MTSHIVDHITIGPANSMPLLQGDVLSDRKLILLRLVIEQYVQTAKPVGSKIVVETAGIPELEVSSATIRNDMKELEALGLLMQPHTSAGRIPTEEGYRYYVKHHIHDNGSLSASHRQRLEEASTASDETELRVKAVAKELADLTDSAILAKIGTHGYYYTGISNMFRQPEFASNEVIVSLSELIDHFDDVLEKVQPTEDVRIAIGSHNPISDLCSAVLTGYVYTDAEGNQRQHILTILGPQRMEYQRNYDLLKYTKTLFA